MSYFDKISDTTLTLANGTTFDELPDDVQAIMQEPFLEASELLIQNDQIIHGILTEMAAQAQIAGNTQTAEYLTNLLGAYEIFKTQTGNNIGTWYDSANSMNNLAVNQNTTMMQIQNSVAYGAQLPPNFSELKEQVAKNNIAIEESVKEILFPELPDIEPNDILMLGENDIENLTVLLEARISAGIYESFPPLDLIGSAIGEMRVYADNSASVPVEAGEILDAFTEEWDQLFEKYGELKSAAYDINNSDDLTTPDLKDYNASLAELYTGQEQLFTNLKALTHQYPQLATAVGISDIFASVRESLDNLTQETDLNAQYLDALNTFTEASLDNDVTTNPVATHVPDKFDIG